MRSHFDRRRRWGRGSIRVPAAALLAAALLLSGCGQRGHGAETDPEKGSDAASLNAALGAELTALAVYRAGGPLLRGHDRVLARRLRSQEQEYADAITKAIRGLGGDVDAVPGEAWPAAPPRSAAEALARAASLESGLLGTYMDASSRLYTAAPRTLAAALAAGHAQHLVAIRAALGAGPAASIPDGFERGELPPNSGAPPPGGG